MIKDKVWALVLELVDEHYQDVAKGIQKDDWINVLLDDIVVDIEDLADEVETEVRDMI